MTRVLLIDDHPIVLQGCKKLLEDAGAEEVDQAQSASEGFGLYRRKKPDVIVIDLAMQAGALSGLSFLRRLRRIDTGPLRTRALGYVARGGTLDVSGMLFANRCTWAHAVAEAADAMGIDPAGVLDADEPEPLPRYLRRFRSRSARTTRVQHARVRDRA